MSQPAKVALLFLLFYSIVSVYPVNIQDLECTQEQKKAILSNCLDYITHKPPHLFVPAHNGPCCSKVRDVPNIDMECIVKLLTVRERIEYLDVKIKNLRTYCSPFQLRPPPHHQVGLDCSC
jgi:hypothetical protein